MIEIKNLEFGYKNQPVVLDNITTKILGGNIVGVLGHNGADKTTLFKLLSGLLKPNHGNIMIEGVSPNVNKKNRGILSYMPEHDGLYANLTLMENIRFRGEISHASKDILDDQIMDILKKVKLWDKRNYKVNELSNGMKKRLSLAAACLNNPKILLLDEPTNGVDQESLKAMHEMLLALKSQGSTILISTHDFHTVEKICDDLLILNQGKIVYDGNNLPLHKLEQTYLHLTKGDE